MPLVFSPGHSEFNNCSAIGFVLFLVTVHACQILTVWALALRAYISYRRLGTKNEKARTLQTRAPPLRKLAYLGFVIWWSCTMLFLPDCALLAPCSPGWLALFLPHHRLLYGPAVPPSSCARLHPCERGTGPFALWLRCKRLAYLAPCCQLAPISRLRVPASAWERGGLHRWGHHWGRTGLSSGLPRWRVTIPSSKSGCCMSPLLLVPNSSLEHVDMCAASRAASLFLSLFPPSWQFSGNIH